MRSRRSSWLLIPCAVAIACAPSVPPLQVPPTLLQVAARYEVRGRVGLFGHTLHFGPYTAEHARVGVQHPTVQKPTLYNGQTERNENHQTGSFSLRGPDGARFGVECQKHQRTVAKHDQTILIDESGNRPDKDGHVVSASETFRCSLARSSGSPMQLFIVQGSSGLVQAEDVELSFLPVNPAADQPALSWKSSAGFLIADEHRALAAVDLTAAPAVTLRRDLSAQQTDELAAVAMALLLLRDMF